MKRYPSGVRDGGRQSAMREKRFKRARHEVHILYRKNIPSRFVTEVRERLASEAE
jgi:hypothetical protein